jgi:hypothetical protein
LSLPWLSASPLAKGSKTTRVSLLRVVLKVSLPLLIERVSKK